MTWKPRTIGLTAMGAALVVGLAYVTFRTDPVPVDLHTVTRSPLVVTINADGVTRIKDIYDVASPITGTALRSPVKVGDPVAAGETLVAAVRPVTPGLLDSRSLLQAQASVQEAEAALHVAQADLARAIDDQDLAKSQFERTQTLVRREVASLTRLEDAAQRLAVANATVEAANARVDMAESTLARTRTMLQTPADTEESTAVCCLEIKAPADGVVLSVADTSERPVVTGAPLLKIGDPANLEIVADLLSTDAVRLQKGATAVVDRWGGPAPLSAVLTSIAPAAQTKISALGIEEQRLDAIFDITSPPQDRASLGDGFAVFLRITEWRKEDVLQVPLSAIFKRNDAWTVFVAEAGTAREQTISIGRQNRQFAEVIDGLSAGDRVVTHPNDQLQSGATIIERTALN
ncbi:efflux RND transporter periplasmic adaptor subunit [Yoonia sediminilitoris]|uniref:HlyD family secretion protein n=1 Tax=Yoonia sediminilitoris TaxID=1286148 RepID=A0A2T6KIU6_9RHOB|nr:HlyD family efflux transporter periplasmic adaptor subunit [Yoonia sediminilitoris]PUB15646.1 HlyD family secretion protein [Yoonia sediminilitoris]RCW96255.1 HlyD family secretion protein [Yoonia sediminilitoris]